MKYNHSTIRALGLASLIALVMTSNSVAVNAQTPSPVRTPKAPCRLDLEDPHISGSLLKSKGKPYMKANVSSICDFPQSQTSISIFLYKKGLFADHIVAQQNFRMKKSEPPTLRVDVFDTVALCVSKELTQYYTESFSKAFIKGKWMYAGRTKSNLTPPIACGTKSLNPFT